MKFTILGLILRLSGSAHALEVEQAYQLIPHQRTVFRLQQSNIAATEAQQVARLGSLAEQAMIERVDALRNGAAKTGYLCERYCTD